jgi:hypothetical protein
MDRFLCLGAVLLVILLSLPACSNDTKAPNKAPPVPDPEGAAKPRAPRGG